MALLSWDAFDLFPDLRSWKIDVPKWGIQNYANETMLFSSSVLFAAQKGGQMTTLALKSILQECGEIPDGYHMVIDTRIHMLMPGMFPAIGGWHADNVPRPGGVHGDQPDPSLFDSNIRHYTVTFSTSTTSQTCFATHPIEVGLPPGCRVWEEVHRACSESLEWGYTYATHGRVTRFDQGTLHRATRSLTRGWRFFLRASILSDTVLVHNQIRRQVQVYMPEGHGW